MTIPKDEHKKCGCFTKVVQAEATSNSDGDYVQMLVHFFTCSTHCESTRKANLKINKEDQLQLLKGFCLGVWFRYNPDKHLDDFIKENPVMAEVLGYETSKSKTTIIKRGSCKQCGCAFDKCLCEAWEAYSKS